MATESTHEVRDEILFQESWSYYQMAPPITKIVAVNLGHRGHLCHGHFGHDVQVYGDTVVGLSQLTGGTGTGVRGQGEHCRLTGGTGTGVSRRWHGCWHCKASGYLVPPGTVKAIYRVREISSISH